MDTQTIQSKTFGILNGILIALLFITFTSCKEGGSATGPDQPVDPQSFEEVIALGGETSEFPEGRTTDTLSVSEPKADDREVEEGGDTETQRWICTTKTFSVLDGNGQFPLFNTNADVIYPANLLQGKTLDKATPSPIVVERAGGTISYNLNNGNLASTFTVDRVSKSSIQNAMNNIIANADEEVVPAKFQLDILEVQSKEQLALEMGLKVSTFATKVSSNMSFSTDREYNRILVKLSQEYYTMSFDLPTSLGQLFDESVTPEQLATYVQLDNPATFISSVIYGRIFYMLVESTSSSQEMEARLNASYGSFQGNVEGSVDVDSFQEMENVKIKVIAYGGDAASTLLAGEVNIDNIVNKLAESTDIRSGLPLSYVVRSVERPDKIVGTSIATEYDVVNCELKGTLPPVTFRSWVDLFEDGVGAATNVRDDIVILFNGAGDKYAWFHDRQIKGEYSVADTAGPLGDIPFDAVGSAVLFDDDDIYLMNKEGTKYAPYKFSPGTVSGDPTNSPFGNYSNVRDINEWGASDDHPFAVEGMGAAVKQIKKPSGVDVSMYLFNNNGDEYVRYEDGEFFQVTTNFADWGPADQHEEFTEVGAASRIQLGSTEHNIFFNKEGTEFVIFDFLGDGGTSQFSQPYVIN